MMQRFFLCNKFAKFTSPFMKQIKRYCRNRQKGLVYETQAMLGEFLGYGATTVANYESGYRLPDLLTAYVIAQHYHVLLDELMEEHHES